MDCGVHNIEKKRRIKLHKIATKNPLKKSALLVQKIILHLKICLQLQDTFLWPPTKKGRCPWRRTFELKEMQDGFIGRYRRRDKAGWSGQIQENLHSLLDN